MAVFTMRIPDGQLEAMKRFAEFHGKPLAEMLRDLMIEKMEDEYDLKVIEEYEQRANAETYTLEEVAQELGVTL